MKHEKVTEGIGYFFVGESECPPCLVTQDNGDLGLADLLPDNCVGYPYSKERGMLKEFKFKITIETEDN